MGLKTNVDTDSIQDRVGRKLPCFPEFLSSRFTLIFRISIRLNYCLYLVCWTCIAAAEETAPAGAALTLENLLEEAQRQNPGFLAEKAHTEELFSKNEAAERNQWPKLSLNGDVRNSAVEWRESRSSSAGVSLSQPIYQGGSLRLRRSIAELQLQQGTLQLRLRELALQLQVKSAYYDSLLFAAKLQEEEKALERVKQHSHNVGLFFEQGKVWRNDLLQADVKVARARKDLVSARNSVLTGRARINQLLGRDVDAPLELAGKLEWRDGGWKWEAIRRLALQDHPQVQSSRLGMELAERSVELAGSGLRPNLNFTGSYTRNYSEGALNAESASSSVGLSATWLLFDGSTRFEEQAALHAVRGARYRIRETEQGVLLQAKQAWLAVEEAGEQVGVLQKALEHAEENYQVNIVRYQEQLGTGNDVLDAEDLLKSTRLDWLGAIRDYWKSVAALESAVARPTSQWGEDVPAHP